MSKKTMTGTTRQSARTSTEKKQKRESPARLSEEEKLAKYRKSNIKALNYKINFKAKTKRQQELFDTIGDKEITITKGSAGTGKSWTVFSKALELLASPNNSYTKIIVLVPTAQVEDIGFLPGDAKQKIENSTLSDKYTIIKLLNQSNNNQGSEILGQLMNEGLLEFDCVSFWRGRTIDNSIVCVSESSSLLPEFIFTILTRIGDSSKYILSGDPEQSDANDVQNKKKIDGLTAAFNKLKNVDEIGKVIFTEEDEIVRNPIIRKIINAWKSECKD